MKVLAIETSCDETAVAVVQGDSVHKPVSILSHVVYSQTAIHEQYGGVYPEAASREHVRKIGIVFEETIAGAMNAKRKTQNINIQIKNQNLRQFVRQEIDAIAVTTGPGLIGSLLVGVNFAKTLAYGFDKPIIAVNHHEGHVAAAWLALSRGSRKPEAGNQNGNKEEDFTIPKLPAVALVVSGGHTQLLLMRGFGDFEVLGRTRDDAAGEAFDKVARLLGLPYPGGPAIAALATASRGKKISRITSLHLPRPLLDSHDFDFSFSGLKTAVARLVATQTVMADAFRQQLADEFQEAVIDVLVIKTARAIETYQPRSLIVAGGVAANRRLRGQLTERLSDFIPIHIPPPSLCTDNAAMIGAAGVYYGLAKQVQYWYDVKADETIRLGES